MMAQVLERNGRGDTGLELQLSAVLRVGFLRSGMILAVLKAFGMKEGRDD